MVHLITHPFVHDALATLRDASTPPDIFRRVARRMSLLIAAEVLKEVPTIEGTVQTPLGAAVARRVGARVTLVPVLRAGLGMIDGVLDLLPTARVGHIGLQRDETTALASRYYVKLPPDLEDDVVLVTDPMLATGGSAVAAIDLLRAAGARDIRFVCVVAAPEGIAAIERRYPDVPIYTPVVDRELNAQKFIVPGLGDFGDRLFGTV
ncbi:MAG: uracil phosphoribosyltransferase [Acidobacteria bacterium]|nr:uracil phosphoribosyltransferase [Acidobacteriota bacterium]